LPWHAFFRKGFQDTFGHKWELLPIVTAMMVLQTSHAHLFRSIGQITGIWVLVHGISKLSCAMAYQVGVGMPWFTRHERRWNQVLAGCREMCAAVTLGVVVMTDRVAELGSID